MKSIWRRYKKQKTEEKRILLLSYNNDNDKNHLMDAVNESQSVEARCVFPFVNLFLRIIRKIMITYKIPGMGIWLGKWKKHLEEYPMIIVIASQYTPTILHWIHKKYPKIRLINYYWDKIEIARYPIEYSSHFENWSFDKMDSQKYGFRYNPQYYSSKLKLQDERVEYDISFVGADRGGMWTSRTELVNKYYNELKNTDLKLFFYYVSCDEKGCREITHEKKLSETEYLRIVAKSKAVFDIVEPGKEWMTLRPLLALTNGKKVITNYVQIINEAFYISDNIFIIAEDRLDIDRLKNFMEKPFVELKSNILELYEVETWAHRFEK